MTHTHANVGSNFGCARAVRTSAFDQVRHRRRCRARCDEQPEPRDVPGLQ